MTNPVAVVSTTHAVWGGVEESRPAYRSVWTYCPGCETAHPFTIEVYDGYGGRQDGQPEPTWEWDGNLEAPTFSPSMLCYSTVHLCEVQRPDYVHIEECPGDCDRPSHGFAWRFPDGRLQTYRVDDVMPEEATQVRTHYLPHVVEPAWGNCHSFLRDGVWDFLGDCAHRMAGQKVPMVPLPDYLAKRGRNE